MKQNIQRKYIAYTRSAVKNQQYIMTQKLLISKYAENNGLKITDWFEDDGVSAVDSHRGLRKAIQIFENEPKGTCGLIACSPNRITRNFSDFYELYEFLETRKVQLQFVEQVKIAGVNVPSAMNTYRVFCDLIKFTDSSNEIEDLLSAFSRLSKSI